MKKLYIIDAGGLSFETYRGINNTSGKLNHSLSKIAEDFFTSKGWHVDVTYIKNKYDVSKETDKFKDADLVIYQFPLWWFAVPGQLKMFIDSIFGYGKLYNGDGRTWEDPDHNYGTGGLMNGKHYVLSITCNAPKHAYEGEGEFLAGDDENGKKLFWWLDKANNFIGMKKAKENFIAYDVVKHPIVEEDIKRFNKYLEDLFNNLK